MAVASQEDLVNHPSFMFFNDEKEEVAEQKQDQAQIAPPAEKDEDEIK